MVTCLKCSKEDYACAAVQLTGSVCSRRVPNFTVRITPLKRHDGDCIDILGDCMDHFFKNGAKNKDLKTVIDVEFFDKLRFPCMGPFGHDKARAIERLAKAFTWFNIVAAELFSQERNQYEVFLKYNSTSIVELAVRSLTRGVTVTLCFPQRGCETYDRMELAVAGDQHLRWLKPENLFWAKYSKQLCQRMVPCLRGEARDLHGKEFLG